ncbi:MAG: glutamine--fructose-6-phosphate aminotransferase [Candidatus Aminicenantes bacterium RBG_19FT_COMBO_65_30]|nr:MAG: glutamine--fructose-6-phosphate aminotransferase [Candidatus Aminicenantes bacterium RBG_19FT_COMBO_65_30]
MCGIIGCAGVRDTVPSLLEGLRRLEYRGYDSAGIAVLDGDGIGRRRVKGKIRDLDEEIRLHPLAGDCGIGHTRWATHGRPSEDNAHPHTDCSGTIALVHNGIVENYWSLKERLRGEGHVFRTETDTEVIVHLVEKHFRGSLEDAVRAAVGELEGAFAVACISSRDPGKIVVARNGPPAVVGLGSGETFISSDITPLLHHTRRVSYMSDGEIAVLTPSGARFTTFAGAPVEKAVETLNWEPAMIEKRGFEHFMAKEIFEQADVVRDTLKSRVSLESGRVFLDDIGIGQDVFRETTRVVLIACGTSYHAGLVGKYLLETLAHIPVDVEYASELRSRDFVMDRGTLVLGISQSGETADTLAALRATRDKARAVLAVTNNINSSMARGADGVLDLHAGPEIGVAATKTFVGQMAALALFALAFAQARGALGAEDGLALVQEFQRVPHKMDLVLGRAADIERAARRYLGCEHYLFLGRWINFPIALEGALKLKEISYTHAEGYAGGEMKHGPIALIDEGMTTLAIVPRDRVYEKMLANISEVQARSGRILAVAFEGDDKARAVAEEVFPIPETNQLFTPFLTILPLQLFAYYSAAAKGFDVDQPRNLAKSVTVE